MTNRTTRLAPSPTGALHLGNARTFLINWAVARRAGWNLMMRIEDIDGPRVKSQAAAQTIDILHWLGIDFDGPVMCQADDLDPYRRAMRELAAQRRIFPCALTRKEVEAASTAPHEGDHELRFEPELRPKTIRADCFDDEATNYRLLVEDESITIDDEVSGRTEHNPFREIGDFVVWTKRGMPAYQLAVVVDDARQGVTDVIRGMDLLPSAARQTLLYRALGFVPPRWWHLPLVLGPDGRRLAKRHGDTRLAAYQDAGVRPERIIGLLAAWCGMMGNLDEAPIVAGDFPNPPRGIAVGGDVRRCELSVAEFRDGFEMSTLPRSPIFFTERDHQWLLDG